MKTIRKFWSLLAAALLLSGLQGVSAQGTAFTYQGVLSQDGSPVTGTNDLLFTLYATNGSVIGGPITNSALGITNGLFLVTLDFGAGSISNTPCLLKIGVRPTGSTNGFTALSPLQPLTPAPQAIFAGTAAGVVNGAISAASLSPGVGSSGQVLKMSSGALVWGTDFNSGGTISNLATGLGLTGGPITNQGTVAINPAVVPQLGVANIFTAGQTILNSNATSQALVLVGAQGQTANLQEWQNSSGAVLANVNANGIFNGNGNGLTNLDGGGIVSGSITADSIGTNQVVKNLNGLMDAVVVAPGNNMILATNANTLTFNTAPGLLSWLIVPGTAQTAQSNKGYLLTNPALATVTLNPSPALADIVRVAGISTNGWVVALNSGQSILAKNLPGNIGVTWTNRGSGAVVAGSGDLSKLVSATAGGTLNSSTNSGQSWFSVGAGSNWVAVAAAGDGSVLVGAVYGGFIYSSVNYGGSWTAFSPAKYWISAAASANGGVLVAAVTNGVYFSTDRGATWTPGSSVTGGFVAVTADGSRSFDLAGGRCYYTTNNGTTWFTNANAPALTCLAISADGTKQVGAVKGGALYTSTDAGYSWTARFGTRTWTDVASSSDGTHLAATASGGQIYLSADSGVTWYAHNVTNTWATVASSTDGTRLIASSAGGLSYSDNLNPVATNSLVGPPYSAVELQYIGNNQFIPLSSSGFVTGN